MSEEERQEHYFLDQMLIECYKVDLSEEELAEMSIKDKKDYIKRVSVLFRNE